MPNTAMLPAKAVIRDPLSERGVKAINKPDIKRIVNCRLSECSEKSSIPYENIYYCAKLFNSKQNNSFDLIQKNLCYYFFRDFPHTFWSDSSAGRAKD